MQKHEKYNHSYRRQERFVKPSDEVSSKISHPDILALPHNAKQRIFVHPFAIPKRINAQSFDNNTSLDLNSISHDATDSYRHVILKIVPKTEVSQPEDE